MLNKLISKKDQGFTLIEIVIVLAIAALIILVVLQAVGAAQKSQRDTTRKQDAGRFVSLLESYASNNNGTYPAAISAATLGTYDATLVAKYTYAACPATVASTTYNIVYAAGAGSRDYTLSVCLEQTNSAQQVHP